ncbi:MAG: type II toxin-antitoxin system PemK/MazF family toxin [Syntrophobacteraceae bacterium]|jgi:mRNA interferase MazF
MGKSGQIVLFNFPLTNQLDGKLRPALIVGKLPGDFDDWLICMISSQLKHYVEGFDEIISEEAVDFSSSGLKTASIIRVGRLAVVDENILIGAIGEIEHERMKRIKASLAKWLLSI